jgi:hypothetical protein
MLEPAAYIIEWTLHCLFLTLRCQNPNDRAKLGLKIRLRAAKAAILSVATAYINGSTVFN